ncbi:AHH domain-containing protein [Clostridium sp. 19966]|uniref:RHS repeat-associated core domain-containing protein n=1 Tax=Clostridium sp. 19966 TaxID=2768166 RepID=UPI0028DDC437|nr:RHS repeat-associated core domain-containing protein [Clostridium sp. 19966]MDT8716234.1 AHH domain-containing protein [Clostridium sp. 19966]
MNLNGVEYYYIRNGQSDIIGLFDKTGAQVVSYTYDTWGKLVSIDGSLKDTVGIKNPYRYRGYRYDTETGLYYLQSRYYNPDWGRFINADAIAGIKGELLSHNAFIYCENNPISFYDHTGYMMECLDDGYGMGGLGSVGGIELAESIASEIRTTSSISKSEENTAVKISKSTEDIKPNQIHHFLTNKSKVYTPKFNKVISKYSLKLNEAWNKVSLPHQGRHAYDYHEYMFEKVKEFDSIANGDKDIFIELFGDLKQEITNNPDMLYKKYWRKP